MRRPALVMCAAALLTACSSGAKPTQSASSPSSAPVSSSSSSSSSAASTSAAPSSTAPASPFEKDPAVVALRTWADLAARGVNAGNFRDPKLLAVETPQFAPFTAKDFADDTSAGLKYPGPQPLLPMNVTSVADGYDGHKVVRVCWVNTGFAVDPVTRKPPKPLAVSPNSVDVYLLGGHWLVGRTADAKDFSCSGVKVPMPTWS